MTFPFRQLAVAAACFFTTAQASHAQLGLEVDRRTFEASIVNLSDSVFEFNAYGVQSESSLLDPDGFVSLRSQGIGSLETGNLLPSFVGELSPAIGPFVSILPDEALSIGFPLGGDGAAMPQLGGDALFLFVSPSTTNTSGPIFFEVPEPSSSAIAIAGLSTVAVRRRKIRVTRHGRPV